MKIDYRIRQSKSGAVIVSKNGRMIFHTMEATNPKMNENELEEYFRDVLEFRASLENVDLSDVSEREDDDT